MSKDPGGDEGPKKVMMGRLCRLPGECVLVERTRPEAERPEAGASLHAGLRQEACVAGAGRREVGGRRCRRRGDWVQVTWGLEGPPAGVLASH